MGLLSSIPRTRTAIASIATGFALSALVWHAGSPGSGSPPPRPNVVLISVDTLRADRLNCYGYAPRVTSPNMDALARDGVLVEISIAAAPWTTPSHLSLLTSLLPSRHGVVASFTDIHHGLAGHGAYPSLADRRLTLAEALRAHGYATAAFTGGATLDPRLGFGQGFDRYDTSMVKISPARMRRLTGWIDDHGGQPFFLFWHTFHVHAPYVSGRFLRDVLPPERARRLRRALGRLARRSLGISLDDSVPRGAQLLHEHHAFTAEACSALYDGGIASFDAFLGELVGFLRTRGLYDHTLIVLTSDHGEQLGERGHGFYNIHGQSLYEEMIHVPLILKLPGEAHAGTRLAGVTSAVDVMPTILDLANATPGAHEMEGRSLRALWEGRKAAGAPEGFALSEALSRGPEKKSLRAAHDKLIVTVDPKDTRRHGRGFLPEVVARVQLFDLLRDPLELEGVLDAPEPGDAARRRARVLEAELRARHPGTPGLAAETTLDDAALERLRALGYLD